MGAPLGNEYWKLRASSGPRLKYETPEQLWQDCQEYFEVRGKVMWNEVPVPYTLASLCIFLDIAQQTWSEWRRERKDLASVITRVDQLIADQKYAGAAVGAYNANIIARDLGLADKKEHSGEVQYTKVERQIVRPSHTDG